MQRDTARLHSGRRQRMSAKDPSKIRMVRSANRHDGAEVGRTHTLSPPWEIDRGLRWGAGWTAVCV
ncbi:hypothetical protein EJB05_39709, partial [Eragrostis curvula]